MPAALRRRGASPCNCSNPDISGNPPKLRTPPLSPWSCRSRQHHSRQQRPNDFRLRPQSQRIALSIALPPAPTISNRPARSRRRPFGVPSPCRKNEQENCRFTWDWQPRQPPAFSPTTGKLSRPPSPSTSPRGRPRAPNRTPISPQSPSAHIPTPPPLPLIPLKQLAAALALLARRKRPGVRCCPKLPGARGCPKYAPPHSVLTRTRIASHRNRIVSQFIALPQFASHRIASQTLSPPRSRAPARPIAPLPHASAGGGVRRQLRRTDGSSAATASIAPPPRR